MVKYQAASASLLQSHQGFVVYYFVYKSYWIYVSPRAVQTTAEKRRWLRVE
jgi:hypothetical protein